MSEQGSTTVSGATEQPAVAPAVAAATASPVPTTRSPGPPAGAEGAAPERIDRRKVREGTVVSQSMDKTAVVAVVERVRHPRYAKTVQRTKRLYVHDEQNTVAVGDRVRVAETRPLSKLKRWRLVEIVERAR
jgi:small subunit ribosomal protein S17